MTETAVTVPIRRLAHGADLPLPGYATEGSAGLDLLAAVKTAVTLQPGGRALIPTGIVIELPAGFEAQVRPRSGLALKHGITVLNAPGTVDSDYRGEVGVVLVNLGESPFVVERASRIAQLVVQPVVRIRWDERAELATSERGAGGFGSTGTHAAGPGPARAKATAGE